MKIKQDFDRIRLGNSIIYIRRDCRDPAFEQALAFGLDALGKSYRLTSVHSSKFARVVKFAVELGGRRRQVFYKEYLYRSFSDRLKHLFRASRARRAWQAGLMLAEEDLACPETIAVGEYRKGLFCATSFLLTLEVANAKPVYSHLPENSKNLTKKALSAKREFIKAFGRTIGKLHAANICHGDLHVANVLARLDGSGWRFFFLDNERTRKFRWLPPWFRLKNLVRINMFRAPAVSNTDRMRFFKAYLEENPAAARNRRIMARRLVSETARRLAKRERKMRGSG